MLKRYLFDEDGVTIYFLGCIPQFVPWAEVTRIEYCEIGGKTFSNQALILEFFGIRQIENCFSASSVTGYLHRHPFRAQCVYLPTKKHLALFFSTIAQYHTIGGMIDLPKGEIFDPQKHCKSRKGI